MKIARFITPQGPRYGIVKGNSVTEMQGRPFGGEKIEAWGATHQLSDVRLMAPAEPTKIVLMSKNYHGTVKKLNLEPSPEILLGMKPVSTMVGPGVRLRPTRGGMVPGGLARRHDGRLGPDGKDAHLVRG